MCLFTYRSQSSVEEIERKGALFPRTRLGRRSFWGWLFGDFDETPYDFSLKKVVFAFPEGYEKTEWLHDNSDLVILDVTPLEHVLQQAKRNDQRTGPISWFSFEPLPSDIIYVLDYDAFRLSVIRETIGENWYYQTAVPLSKYGNSYKMPEAVILNPINKSRLHLEAVLHNNEEIAAHAAEIKRKGTAKPEPKQPKPKQIVKAWTNDCPYILV